MCEAYLKKALLEKKLPNTLLFSGLAQQTKEMAFWLASELLKTQKPAVHPDFHWVIPESKGGLHSIEAIRQSIHFSHASPYSASVKVLLIEAAENMQPAAANALLKTLEEPLLDSYWILLSERPQEMLPTVLSRCAKFYISSSEIEPSSSEFQEAKMLLLGLLETSFSYPKLFSVLEKVETLMEDQDSMPLLIALAHAFRDRDSNWHEALEQARLGIERNIKLFTCLEFLFLSVCDVC